MTSVNPINDPKYHLWGLLAISKGMSSSSNVRLFILKRIRLFNRRYRLTTRESPLEKVGEMVVSELEQMGYVQKSNNMSLLTSKGKELCTRLQDRKTARDATITDLMVSMFEAFPEMKIFLDHLQRADGFVYIPKIPGLGRAKKIVRKSELSPNDYLQACQRYITTNWKLSRPLNWEKHLLSEKVQYWMRVSTSKKLYDLAKTIFRDYFLTTYFGGDFGDVKYKVLRDRLHYFGVINWSEHLLGLDGEMLYSLLWKDKRTKYAKEIRIADKLYYYSHPSWKEISRDFVPTLWRIHKSFPGVGYVPVMDLRDNICYRLKISDYDFDVLLKRAFLEGQKGRIPVKILADPSIITVSSKRLPINFGSGMGLRTLIALERTD